MKTIQRLFSSTTALTTFAVLALACPATADDGKNKHDHDHDHAKMAGPNGGRVLHQVHPHAELFVTKDRKLQLTFLDGKGKPTALKEQSASGICGKRSAPTRMKFSKEGNTLLSDKALPKGLHIPTVLQLKMSPKAKATIIRLNLNLEDCPTCDYLEYACTCDHHGDHKHGDKKK